MDTLFSPITINGVAIKNRIVMPPMVCFGWAAEDGLMTDKHLKHYEARAKGGTALIILEATAVEKDGRLADTQLGVWSDDHIAGLRELGRRCHAHGAVVLVQIHHAGLKTPLSVTPVAVGPSVSEKVERPARALTIGEIEQIKNEFVSAARRVKEAGLDGVELHGAHGYLLGQFASRVVNHRTDEYGGGLESRMRLTTEIISAIKKQAGVGFIVGCRMGCNEPALADGLDIADALVSAGIDLLHVSAGSSGSDWPTPPEGFSYNGLVYGGTEVHRHVAVPVIVVNGIRTPRQAAWLVENGLTDLVAIGHSHLADPNWATAAREGRDPLACQTCKPCHWYKDGQTCPHYAL